MVKTRIIKSLGKQEALSVWSEWGARPAAGMLPIDARTSSRLADSFLAPPSRSGVVLRGLPDHLQDLHHSRGAHPEAAVQISLPPHPPSQSSFPLQNVASTNLLMSFLPMEEKTMLIAKPL